MCLAIDQPLVGSCRKSIRGNQHKGKMSAIVTGRTKRKYHVFRTNDFSFHADMLASARDLPFAEYAYKTKLEDA